MERHAFDESYGGYLMATGSAAIHGAPGEHQEVAPSWHTLVLLIIIVAWALLGYKQAGMMRAEDEPHRLPLYFLTMGAEWVLFAYVVFGIQRKRVTLRELTGPKWQGAVGVLTNVGIALAFWITSVMILVIVGLLLKLPKGQTQSVQFMVPHSGRELAVWILLSITAGICEETVFRGYLQKQFIAWTRNVPAGLILSALVFGFGHIYQGFKQAVLIAVYGALFGVLAALRRDIKPGIVAHAWQDSLAGFGQFLLSKGYLKMPGT